MWLLISFTIFVSVLIWDYLYKRHRYGLLKISRIQGPSPTLPVLGDALVTARNDNANIFDLFQRLALQFGKVYRLWLFHRLVFVVQDPKFLEVILSSQQVIKKSFVYDMFSWWLGDGLLISYGTKWHAKRKILTPTYHFKILEEFVEVFDRQSQVFVKKLFAKADGKTAFDIFPIVCLTALDIISETAMGVKINAQENPNFEYAMAVKKATDILGTRSVKPEQYYDLGFILTALPSYLTLKKSIKIMHDFTDKVINDRRATMASGKGLDTETNESDLLDVGQKKRMAFLDVLLQSTLDDRPLTHEEIRDEVDTFMFEGHDTTTSGISFCLYLLSRHSDIQQKAFEEIRQVFGDDKDKSITMRDLQNLKYLEAVIKESLRLYPPVPMIGREAEQDVKIGDQIVPANTSLCLLIYAAGRDPDYFDQPNDFKPERFYNELSDKMNPFAYVPFSAGPRNCIGQKFAMLEMKSTISRVLRYFELLPLGAEVIPIMTLILRSSSGVNVGLRPRKY